MINNVKRALIIVTSHAILGKTGRQTGFYYEELATPYWEFVDAGYTVDIASINGGVAPADPSSVKSSDQQPKSVRRFLNDKSCMNKVNTTKSILNIDPNSYQIVFLPGGHGTMWDFAQSMSLATLLSKLYQNGAVLGSVCHGAAGLLNVKTADGIPLVENRKINSFTEAEEQASGLDNVVPFILETELKKLGAHFECAANFEPYVVSDGRLITGQNPASSGLVAAAILKAANHLYNKE
ncbi:type 1 glutamine amidotransferase domain-containing protein [Xenorhabdus bovienii]|uniref:type 1 glutamine amidotransferase domain-containing protein n=1 Tax=Xenorhabdus bovienii TaxID=40576 RepID=UPI00237D2A5A|nr:type 1 glutamine amidotransferase domain-containing protein [Xenorhabdus bovienii]MDE1482961.1 type 1 glutamine amidotransferase domain-containing protein [Xenorhabdus bovienii]MDE9433730.1 type 1 glutamine amidotransferase domain-containing protein [Xenorhabdus bovienii]MDE9443075.1 type 1 glutamine amidotransferase domain-containing protein [Xenorhabdus bovienii]MDE9491356.1 type 1 glutamine amidotransferase domain-containing protein [Xenorhabdus bovienii]MDE9507707.1 type 1 glutamine ami